MNERELKLANKFMNDEDTEDIEDTNHQEKTDDSVEDESKE